MSNRAFIPSHLYYQVGKDSRDAVLHASIKLASLGLNKGTSGNVSVRSQEGFLITPSGLVPEEIKKNDIVAMNLVGEVVKGGGPSSEWRFHRDIYVCCPDVGAIVHVHSLAATAFSSLRRDLPPFHYMIAAAGGNSVRCAPYALFGTQQLSDLAINALSGRKACLLANHGMIAVGSDIEEALSIAIEVESLCEQYILANQIAPPILLSDQEMQEVLEKFKTYGRQKEVKFS